MSDHQTKMKDQTALITGASRGFGLALAKRYAAMGANVVLCDVSEEMCANAQTEISKITDRYAVLSGDVSIENTSRLAVELAVEQFGGLDIAANNAGILQENVRLHELTAEAAQTIIQVDLMGVFFGMKYQLPAMMARFEQTSRLCNIINTASAAGLMASPLLSVYSAAKHGVVGLTRSAAVEYARKGIRINAVCPAFSDTDMVKEALENSRHGPEEGGKRLSAAVPMQRLATIDEVVQAMVWATSEENSFFTGQTISIDGGLAAF